MGSSRIVIAPSRYTKRDAQKLGFAAYVKRVTDSRNKRLKVIANAFGTSVPEGKKKSTGSNRVNGSVTIDVSALFL